MCCEYVACNHLDKLMVGFPTDWENKYCLMYSIPVWHCILILIDLKPVIIILIFHTLLVSKSWHTNSVYPPGTLAYGLCGLWLLGLTTLPTGEGGWLMPAKVAFPSWEIDAPLSWEWTKPSWENDTLLGMGSGSCCWKLSRVWPGANSDWRGTSTGGSTEIK